MRFITIFSTLTAIASVLAVQPGGDSIGAGLSDEFEQALYKEVGPTLYDGLCQRKALGLGSCLSCIPTVISAGVCLANCVTSGFTYQCVTGCVGISTLCGCIDCFPEPIPVLVRGLSICGSSFAADPALFSKVYLGRGTPEDEAEAKKLGYDVAKFAEQPIEAKK